MCAGFWFGTSRQVIFALAHGGHDGFAAFALITAGQAVDLERGPRGALFGGGEAAFAEKFRHAESVFAIARL